MKTKIIVSLDALATQLDQANYGRAKQAITNLLQSNLPAWSSSTVFDFDYDGKTYQLRGTADNVEIKLKGV